MSLCCLKWETGREWSLLVIITTDVSFTSLFLMSLANAANSIWLLTVVDGRRRLFALLPVLCVPFRPHPTRSSTTSCFHSFIRLCFVVNKERIVACYPRNGGCQCQGCLLARYITFFPSKVVLGFLVLNKMGSSRRYCSCHSCFPRFATCSAFIIHSSSALLYVPGSCLVRRMIVLVSTNGVYCHADH